MIQYILINQSISSAKPGLVLNYSWTFIEMNKTNKPILQSRVLTFLQRLALRTFCG